MKVGNRINKLIKNPFFVSTIGFFIFALFAVLFKNIIFLYVGNFGLSFLIGVLLYLDLNSIAFTKKQIEKSNLIYGTFMVIFMIFIFKISHPIIGFYFCILMGNCVAMIVRNYYYEKQYLKTNI